METDTQFSTWAQGLESSRQLEVQTLVLLAAALVFCHHIWASVHRPNLFVCLGMWETMVPIYTFFLLCI
jgi:hypothetical protein